MPTPDRSTPPVQPFARLLSARSRVLSATLAVAALGAVPLVIFGAGLMFYDLRDSSIDGNREMDDLGLVLGAGLLGLAALWVLPMLGLRWWVVRSRRDAERRPGRLRTACLVTTTLAGGLTLLGVLLFVVVPLALGEEPYELLLLPTALVAAIAVAGLPACLVPTRPEGLRAR